MFCQHLAERVASLCCLYSRSPPVKGSLLAAEWFLQAGVSGSLQLVCHHGCFNPLSDNVLRGGQGLLSVSLFPGDVFLLTGSFLFHQRRQNLLTGSSMFHQKNLNGCRQWESRQDEQQDRRRASLKGSLSCKLLTPPERRQEHRREAFREQIPLISVNHSQHKRSCARCVRG